VSAESSKKPTVAVQAPAASQKAVVPTPAGVADPASRTGLDRVLHRHGSGMAGIAATPARKAAGFASAASVRPTRHSTRTPRLTVPSMAPSEALGAD
jgi:hypothetical protein